MRRRAIRDIGTIIGVAVILLGIVFVNSQLRREDLKTRSIQWRETIEDERGNTGMEVLKWDVIQSTEGTRKKGPTFTEDLLAFRDSMVNLVGFMVPLYEFREVSEFILLPMPIECYFCESPPMRDVVLVRMAEGKKANLVNEPVLIHGDLRLQEGPNTKFFYTVENAEWGAGQEGAKLTQKRVTAEHMSESVVAKEGELLDAVSDKSKAPSNAKDSETKDSADKPE